jgi:hypothetical protein
MGGSRGAARRGESIIESMVIDMNEAQVRTLEQVRLVVACAVKRRRFPVGESPTRQMLQPEATGAGMEVTKCLKRASSEGWLDQQGTDLPGQQSEAP